MLNNRRDMIVSCRRVDIPLSSARASPLTAVHFPCTNCFTILAREVQYKYGRMLSVETRGAVEIGGVGQIDHVNVLRKDYDLQER